MPLYAEANAYSLLLRQLLGALAQPTGLDLRDMKVETGRQFIGRAHAVPSSAFDRRGE